MAGGTNVPLTANELLARAMGAVDFGNVITHAFANGGIEEAFTAVLNQASTRITRALDTRVAKRASSNTDNVIDGTSIGLAAAEGGIQGLQIAQGGGTAGHQMAQAGMAAIGTGASVGMAAGATAGLAAGAITMGISAAVIGAIIWYRSTHPPEWQQLGVELGRDLGTSITEELAKNIADNAEALHSPIRGQVLRQFQSVIQEAGGVDAGNVESFVSRLTEVFTLLSTGQFTAVEATRVLDQNFASMVEHSTDGIGRISAGLRNIIQLDEMVGTHSTAVEAWRKAQTGAAATGINAVLNVGGGSRSDFTDLTGLAQTGIAAQMATGSTLFEALASQSSGINKLQEDTVAYNLSRAHYIGPAQLSPANSRADMERAASEGFSTEAYLLGSDIHALQYLIDNWDDLNHDSSDLHKKKLDDMNAQMTGMVTQFEVLTEDEGTRTLFIENQLMQTSGTLLDGINGLSSAVVNFDNLGIETVGMFEAQERQGSRMYSRLQGEVAALGGGTREALIPMQGWLHQAVIEAEKLGVPLDENTQLMVDQSKELGIWHDKADPARDMTERLAAAVERLVNWLNNIPENVHTDVTTSFHQVGQPPTYPTGPIDQTPAPSTPGRPDDGSGEGGGVDSGGGGGEATGSPTNPNGMPTNAYHGGPVRYFGRGGPVSWRPSGADTVPAMLDPREGVVTAAGMSRIGVEGLRNINSGTTIRASADMGSISTILSSMRSDQAARDNLMAAIPGMVSRAMKEAMQEVMAVNR
jgi:hypothetical protein